MVTEHMTDKLSDDELPEAGALARLMADRIGHGQTEKVQRFADIAVEFYRSRSSAKTAGEAKINDAAWASAVQAEYGRKPIWVYLADCKGNVSICRALLYAYLEALPSTLTNEPSHD